MTQQQSLYRTLTLEASLEEVARLGEGYLLSSGGEEWTARDLLTWMQHGHPDLIFLPVALVPPDANGDGGVFEVDPSGEALFDVPLFRIERRPLMVSPL